MFTQPTHTEIEIAIAAEKIMTNRIEALKYKRSPSKQFERKVLCQRRTATREAFEALGVNLRKLAEKASALPAIKKAA